MNDSDIQIEVTFTQEEAIALATFFKRSTFSDYRTRAVSDNEVYLTLNAGAKVKEAFGDKGVDIR